MSPLEGFLVLYVVLSFSAAGMWAVIRWRLGGGRPPYRAARWDEDRKDWVNEEAHDVGPDGLRLLEDLEAEMKAYAERVADYYDTTTGDHS
jgi:hypothetical protein